VLKQFEGRGAQLLGLSCDSVPALKVWSQSLGGINYPLMSDFYPHGKVSEALGIFNAEGGYPKRSITIIDLEGVVRACHIYPPGTLPQADEVLAELSGLQA
jgi:alkyl hydroperoxide reductase subunit AhpC